MFSRISTIAFYILFAFTLLAAASPAVEKRNVPTTTVTVTTPAPTPTSATQCSTGAIQCCTQTLDQESFLGSFILNALQIAVEGVDLLLGLDCTGLDVLGGTCTAQSVCCENNALGGLISVGCIAA
ncbi:hypothetical protein BDP27DRAFT_1489741 [Rhodocollybia butyracea]|uniref:Hydrophobin n=1 Tax=Rhodocollybia butyracea TaxID=206335 RepID=A0A9P5TZU2_9AGAR|nr:hypothetical protein BDP27DRAFT_1489741 [Rhodocollybia butyracea]